MIGVAQAKRDFSKLIERVASGERVVVVRHGRPVLALSRPGPNERGRERPVGLASVAGVLSEWEDLPQLVKAIYASRASSEDRPIPNLLD